MTTSFRSETVWYEKKASRPFSLELGTFVETMEYRDLPDYVIHETKRVVFDSVACALGGTTCDKGRISIEVARKIGEARDSSIIGTSHRVSCASAAFAHGELISALDFDSFEIPQGHIPPCCVPPPLSVAESTGASGRDLILATALALEVECRIHRALTPRVEVLDAGAGKTRVAFGESQYVFGGAAGAGKLLGLDGERIAHALSIAVHFCPVPVGRKFQVTKSPLAMTKYGESGWPAMGSVVAALLASSGYVGDLWAFDGEFGFWRMYSYGDWEPHKALEQLGQSWVFPGLAFKPYPCHRTINGPLDAFTFLIEQHNLRPEEIDLVRVFGNPKVMNQYRKDHIGTHVAAQFHVPHNVACAAFRLKPGPDWQRRDVINDEKIAAFRDKVITEGLPGWEDRVKDDPKKRWGGAVEVTARGKIYREDRLYARGTALPELEMSEEEMKEKFRNCAEGILTRENTEMAINYLSGLDEADDVRDIMNLLKP
ncbi:MAG: MmgE/PrpD family protein [Deltaproteobacteria bacterium]|nr:MmgE/PrpD family protein [Deltaproteobacteria bacterium]MBW2063805.1 MmgE/PrpD family protein [Deltaproteobacteria bacterium]